MIDLKRKDLLFPELSFQIIGCAFEVHNALGFGFKENIYQKALALSFKDKLLEFIEQLTYQIKFKDEILSTRRFDFVVEDKIVIEIKRDDKFSKANIDQTIDYLKTANLTLGILINFGREGVVYKRLINI